jgi:hypothetical protein
MEDGRMADGGAQFRIWTATMNEDQLIKAIRERAARPELRNDFADRFGPEVSPPAAAAAVDEAERAIGYALHPFHRRLLTEIGNGGFGPGAGLVGLPGGTLDIDGRSLAELSRMLQLELGASPPFPVVFLCDWGCGVWGCLDCETDAVLTISEDGLKDSGQTICAWFEDWVSGVELWRRVFAVRQQLVQDPSTKQSRWEEFASGTLGVPYVRRR